VIVLDSSVLVEIIKGEADAERLLELLAGEECAIGAPTLVETRAWCSINLAARSSTWLEYFVGSGRGEMADAASGAFDGSAGRAGTRQGSISATAWPMRSRRSCARRSSSRAAILG